MSSDDTILICCFLVRREDGKLLKVFTVYWRQCAEDIDNDSWDLVLRDVRRMRDSGTFRTFGSAERAMKYAEMLNRKKGTYQEEDTGEYHVEYGIQGPYEFSETLDLSDQEIGEINPWWEEPVEEEDSEPEFYDEWDDG